MLRAATACCQHVSRPLLLAGAKPSHVSHVLAVSASANSRKGAFGAWRGFRAPAALLVLAAILTGGRGLATRTPNKDSLYWGFPISGPAKLSSEERNGTCVLVDL